MLEKLKKHQFLFEELVQRDFKKKYKRTTLGIAWSLLSPLLNLLVMSIVFTQFFGRQLPHYTIYLFSGNLFFSYFSDSTSGGMLSLVHNADIFSKINVPKYIFILSRAVQSFLNFAITFLVYFIFVAFDGLPFTFKFLYLIFPIITMTIFNIGMGMILSALYVFFKDIEYLYSIFTMLLMYLSAIFYSIDMYSPTMQIIFYANPVYVHIAFLRDIVINGVFPSMTIQLLCIFYAAMAIIIGSLIYKKYNHKFLYYV